MVDQVRALLRLRMDSETYALILIAEATVVPLSSLMRLVYQPHRDPQINAVQRVYDYLTGYPLTPPERHELARRLDPGRMARGAEGKLRRAKELKKHPNRTLRHPRPYVKRHRAPPFELCAEENRQEQNAADQEAQSVREEGA